MSETTINYITMDTETRLQKLEVSMREHTHSSIDSTTPLPFQGKYIQSFSNQATITPRMGFKGQDLYIDITAIAQNFTIANVEGTPQNFDKMIVRIKDNGTGRTITFGSEYAAGGVDLPTTTTASKIMHLGFIYDTANSLNQWLLVAIAEQS